MIVQTKNGKIRGFENASVAGGKKYFSYLGVPYAKPPTGDLRFAPPKPVEDWNEIYDATYERDKCQQLDPVFGGGLTGSDDCLYLNIHTPDVNPKSLKPVLFYIHGGGFFCGSGEEAIHGADYLINHDVVLVTINYRVHILGFLNLEIPECPGNAGLKDQVIALKWVKKNIKAFGGDPDNITINGCSAGGTSVNLLMISPLAEGLFHKAIIQCGTALSAWALTYEPVKWAFEAAKALGFEGDDRLELLNFLRNEPSERLTQIASKLLADMTNEDHPARGLYCPFSPSVERIKDEAFLPDSPENLSTRATPVPCIAGYVKVERIYLGKYISENLANASESMIEEIVRSNFKVTASQLARIVQKLTEFYFHQNDQRKSNVEKLDELLTDICCIRFYDALEFVAKSNLPLYVFQFTYFSEDPSYMRKELDKIFPLTKNPFHGEEQRFILSCKKDGRGYFEDSKDIQVQTNMCQLWVNFMKTGNPTSEGVDAVWKPHTENEPYYLDIGAKLELKNEKIEEKRINFLKNLLQDIEINI